MPQIVGCGNGGQCVEGIPGRGFVLAIGGVDLQMTLGMILDDCAAGLGIIFGV